MDSKPTVTTFGQHGFHEGDIICTRHVDNGFWKLVWYWILQKDLDRGDFHTISKVLDGTTFTL